LTPWSNLKKRSDVTERLCALMDKAVVFDVVTEFPRPIGCPAVIHQVILSVLRLTEHDRAAVEDLQSLFTRVLRGEKICMSSEVVHEESAAASMECAGKSAECARTIDIDSCYGKKEEGAAKSLECSGNVDADSSDVAHDDSAAGSFECAGKVDIDGEATEQIFESIETLENSIDDSSLAGDVEDFENCEDTDMMPVIVRRKSLLNSKTGEEEYFHPDDDSGMVAMEGDIHNFGICVGENEVCLRREVERCSDGNLQPQHSLMSTAATSQADSGASTPRTPPRTDCNKPRFECPVLVESIIRCSTSTEVSGSSIFSQPTAGVGFEHAPLPGRQAFRDAQNLSNLPEQRHHISLVHGNSKPFQLLRSSTPTQFRSSTPTVLFRPSRSQSVVQERSVTHNSCVVNQVPEDSWQCAIKTNSGAQRTMPLASGFRTVFSVASGGSTSPMRLSCPSWFA